MNDPDTRAPAGPQDVRYDMGGWISGPCLPRQPYELNVGRFRADHPGYLVAIGFEGFGFRGRRCEGGPWVSAATLDELAARLAAGREPSP